MLSLRLNFMQLLPSEYQPDAHSLNNFLAIQHSLHRLLIKRQYFSDYYERQSNELRQFFADEGFDIADALFDILRELKGDKLRKNGYVPDYGHEIDQLIPVMRIIQNLDQEEREKIEDQHGSLERWVCSILAHDMGEDYGFFHEDLVSKIREKFESKGKKFQLHHRQIADHAGKSMECLTHYRKFSYYAAQELFGEEIELPAVKPGETVPLDHLKDLFWDKMDVLEQGRENLQVYARWNDKTNAPTIIVTRYGRTSEDSPYPKYGAGWNIYIQSILKDDLYDLLTKMGDRVNGVATRLAINARKIDKYDKYLDETRATFDFLNPSLIAQKFFPDYENSPITQYTVSISRMMGLMEMIGRKYANNHPDRNPDGTRGMDPENIDLITEDIGISPIHFSHLFPDCMEYFSDLQDDQPSHPIGMIMRDWRLEKDSDYYYEAGRIYDSIQRALLEQGCENMQFLIRGEEVKVRAGEWEKYPQPQDCPLDLRAA